MRVYVCVCACVCERECECVCVSYIYMVLGRLRSPYELLSANTGIIAGFVTDQSMVRRYLDAEGDVTHTESSG
jgi:hypothetical protein